MHLTLHFHAILLLPSMVNGQCQSSSRLADWAKFACLLMACETSVAEDMTSQSSAGSTSLSYSHLMNASWLLRSSQGQPITALPHVRLMRARVAAGQASIPSMQVCWLHLLVQA